MMALFTFDPFGISARKMLHRSLHKRRTKPKHYEYVFQGFQLIGERSTGYCRIGTSTPTSGAYVPFGACCKTQIIRGLTSKIEGEVGLKNV